nr:MULTISPECIES: polymorphic toxin type 46 domain-containing protein [Pseudomonas]
MKKRSRAPLRNSKPKTKIKIRKRWSTYKKLVRTGNLAGHRDNQDIPANFFKSQGYKSADYIPLFIETLHGHRKEVARLTIVKGTNGDLSGLQ